MARYFIKTVVEFSYESDNDEFDSEEAAEQFGWNYEDMMYDGVYSIEVEELEDE